MTETSIDIPKGLLDGSIPFDMLYVAPKRYAHAVKAFERHSMVANSSPYARILEICGVQIVPEPYMREDGIAVFHRGKFVRYIQFEESV